eukprot:6816118-Pyramimonas_sp.AAC.1
MPHGSSVRIPIDTIWPPEGHVLNGDLVFMRNQMRIGAASFDSACLYPANRISTVNNPPPRRYIHISCGNVLGVDRSIRLA